MNLEITSQNLHLLLPGKVSRVVQIYADDHKIPLQTALCLFYGSDTYKKLAEETTKFWHLGPVALYEEFSDELKKKQEKKKSMKSE